MDILLAKKPESFTRLIISSLHLYCKALPRVFFLSLILSLIVFLPRIMALIQGQETSFAIIREWSQRVWFMVLNLALLFVFTGMLWRVRCVQYQEKESLINDITIAGKKFLFILAAAVLQGLFFAIFLSTIIAFAFYLTQNQIGTVTAGQLNGSLTIACVFALYAWISIFIYYLFIFYLPLILTEDKGIIASLKKSAMLVWGHWRRTFGFLLIPWVTYCVILLILKNVFNLNIHIYLLESLAPSTWPSTIMQVVIFAIYLPWFAAALLVQLRDLELRKQWKKSL